MDGKIPHCIKVKRLGGKSTEWELGGKMTQLTGINNWLKNSTLCKD